jgi:endonuclease/exonuclease/phosphatase family metal-dependent hydrolase
LISPLVKWKRRWRRRFSRTRLLARLLNRDLSAPHGDEPGVIILQIDGLSRTQLEQAIRDGRMPFLKKMVGRGHFQQLSFYSGLPSTTPAVQAEVMFGARAAVPAFQFLHRESGKTVLMYEQEWAKRIGAQLASERQPLLEGGRSYSNIYAAGAVESRFCAETMDVDNLRDMTRPWKLAIVACLYLFTMLRVLGLAILEFFIAAGDMVRGLAGRQPWRAELHCIPSRIGVSIVMREWLRVMLKLSIEEGAPIIYGNFLGYDEQAHRRGPGSAFAHWGLKGIDDVIRDVFKTAHKSDVRDYEVVVFSDHGQQQTAIFEDETGVSIQAAAERALKNGPLAGRAVRGLDDYGSRGPETDQRGRRLLRMKRGRASVPQATADELANDVIVTALGPLGHIYLPIELSVAEKRDFARRLVDDERVPLVLFPGEHGELEAHNPLGRWRLPEDAAQVFGPDHPFLAEAAGDVMRLAQHPDAGDLMVSGWNNAKSPSTFVHENGAHGSFGSEETRGFALVPHAIHLHHRRAANGERYIRGVDLYRGAWDFVHPDRPLTKHRDHASEAAASPVEPPSAAGAQFKVMTYNIHSCIGIDGKIRPERIVSVIRSCGADVIALQEVDANRQRSRGHEQARRIADALAMSHHYYAVSDWNGEQYGLAIISRFPLEHVQSGHLTPVDHAHRSEARGALWVKLTTPAGVVNVVNTHFGLRREERLRQTEILLSDGWLGQIPAAEPIILCGDLNAGPKSPVCRAFGRRLVDVACVATNHRPRATFISTMPVRRLDYIFASEHFTVNAVHSPRTPTVKLASDHLPVCAELKLALREVASGTHPRSQQAD